MVDKNHAKGILHHKFCLIDNDVLITGSYNWTNNAKKNSENIIVQSANEIDDFVDFIEPFADEFDSVFYKYGIKNIKEEDEKMWKGVYEQEAKTKIKWKEAEKLQNVSKGILKLGNNKDALEKINEAIAIHSNNISFYLTRHLIYRNMDRLSDSFKDLIFYINRIKDLDEFYDISDNLNTIKLCYSAFIRITSYKPINSECIYEINGLTYKNLEAFLQFNIEPYKFIYGLDDVDLPF